MHPLVSKSTGMHPLVGKGTGMHPLGGKGIRMHVLLQCVSLDASIGASNCSSRHFNF